MPAAAPLAGDLPLHETYRRADAVAAPGLCSRYQFRVPSPSARIVSRSGVPDARGSGSAPATIGNTVIVRVATELRFASLHLRLAPELIAASNADYLIFPAPSGERSSLSSPLYTGAYSADLPSRPGDAQVLRLDLGESGLWWIARSFSFAATTSLPDWGPGVGEGLVLGRSTAGLPRIEAATWRALGGGLMRARWFGGVAIESRFFDRVRDNDLRSVAGLRVSYERPSWTVGLARTVMDGSRGGPMRAALQPLARTASDSVMELLSADFLWRNTAAGSLAWLELARQQPVRTLQDLTLMPQEGLALRVGASQRIAESAKAVWRLSAEATRLDQPAERTGRAPRDLYTSQTVPQGWTHRGRPLGAGLGPGGQRQMIALDREGVRWRLGGFLERARWNDDALYREFLAYQNRHDVTLQGGVRVGGRLPNGPQLFISLSAGKRLNYLFQNASFLAGYRTDDVSVAELSLTLTP